jgi:hypothetical protein
VSSRAIVGSRSWVLWIPLALLQKPAAPAVPGPQPPVASQPSAVATIELERTLCFGTCPSFVVALDSDGTVRWKGREYVGALERTTHVPPFEVRYLFDRFHAVDFAGFEARYGSDDPDSSMMLLRMRAGDVRKSVELGPTAGRIDSEGREIEGWRAEEELIALGDAIESVLGLERWIWMNDPVERAPRTTDYSSEAFALSADDSRSARMELTTESGERGTSSYRIVLCGDGRVEWEGRSCVREIGQRSSAIPVEQVRWLLHRFEEAKFFELAEPDFDAAHTSGDRAVRGLTTLALRLPGREHAIRFRVPSRRPLTWYPDSTHRTAIQCDALADTIRVLVRADRWIGWGWETTPGHEKKPR